MKDIKTRFRQRGWVNFGHTDYNLLVKKGYVSKAFDDTAYKFSFVRNPYDRAVSMYFDTKERGRINRYTKFLRFCQRRIATPFDALGLHSTFGTSAFNPQVRWLENVKLDFLGRYEHLIRDFATLTENLGIGYVELPRIRTTEHEYYMNYYCPETLDIVEHAYREDFERYNYPIYNRQCAGSVPG